MHSPIIRTIVITNFVSNTVGCKKCITLLYNFLICIYTKREQRSGTDKNVQNKWSARDDFPYNTRKTAIRCQRSRWHPRSPCVVTQLHGRRGSGSPSTTSPTALPLAPRSAKQRIPRDEPCSTTSLTVLSVSFTTATPGPQPSSRPRGYHTSCLSCKIDWHATCCDALLLLQRSHVVDLVALAVVP